MIDLLLELIYPRRCIFCDKVMPWGKECENCSGDIEALRNNNRNMPLKNSAAAFVYMDKARKAMLNFKYYGHVDYKRRLAEEMALVLPKTKFDFLVSIPAYRHYQHVTDTPQHLAKELSKRTGFKYHSKYVKKIRQTLRQHNLSYEQRQENLIGCFWANPAKVRGKTILLVDDIITTGATMRECSKCLYDAGAKYVFCIAACRTTLN